MEFDDIYSAAGESSKRWKIAKQGWGESEARKKERNERGPSCLLSWSECTSCPGI